MFGEDYRNMEAWLLHNTEPWDKVIDYWRKTVDMRKNIALCDRLKQWPLYKHSKAVELFEIDFVDLYPNKENNLFGKWNDFTQICCKAFKSTVKDPSYAKIIEKLGTFNYDDANEKNFDILLLFHAAIKPSARIQHNKKLWKVSIKDSQFGFLLELNTLNDLELQIENRKKKYLEWNVKVQPFIFIIEKKCYVYVDDYYYKCTTLLSAIDLCFKLINCFNLEYSKDCGQVWEFIQKFFYGITTEFDNNFSQVTNFISVLNNRT